MHPELVGIASSSRQIKHNQKSVQSLQEQIKLKESQLQFYKRKLEKDKSLLDQGMIPDREFQNTQMQYSDMQNQLKSLSSQQISIDKNNADYQKQIADYQISKTQNESQKLIALKQARITLLEEINTWYKTNVFSSPIDGKLQYNIPINENQFITQGTELFTITPESKQQIFCNMIVPMGGMGKVILDQRVIIRLEQYPDEEYGVLYGKVEEISPSPNKEKNYSIKVSLDNGLNTSYNKEISFKPNMEGNADIVTKDKSFLHRVFEQLLKLIKR
jgi:multidrug resistance efflux pump